MEVGMVMVLDYLERTSPKLPLSKEDLNVLDQVEKLLGSAQMDEAIKKLDRLLTAHKGSQTYQDWIALKGRWNALRQDSAIHGRISSQEASSKENDIRIGFLEFMKELRGLE
jgi:hypothetical protein